MSKSTAALTPRQREIAAKCREELQYYLAEAPITASLLADKLGFFGSRESRRRRAREAVRWARKIYGQQIGSCARGYFLSRSREDRIVTKDFLHEHGLSELHTAAIKQPQPQQGVLI